MLGVETTAQTMPYAGPPQLRQSRPEPEQRVVEGSAESTLERQRTDEPTEGPTQTALDKLSTSARRFADILDSTGDVQVASTITGFPVRQIDLYA